MDIKEIVELKKRAENAKGDLEIAFSIFNNDCEYRKKVYHDGRDEWYKCIHKDYAFSNYTDITPCNSNHCPLL